MNYVRLVKNIWQSTEVINKYADNTASKNYKYCKSRGRDNQTVRLDYEHYEN